MSNETPEAAVEAIEDALYAYDEANGGVGFAMSGRVLPHVVARIAVDALIAQGWTPPGTEDAK